MKSHVMLVILAVVAGLVLTQAAASYGSPRGCSASTLLRISRAGTFAGAGVHHSLSDLVSYYEQLLILSFRISSAVTFINYIVAN